MKRPWLAGRAVLLLLLFAAPAAAQRLSGDVLPEEYMLWFAPDLEAETFRGRETIRVQLKTPSNAITLHAAEITFGEVTITAAGGTQIASVTLDPATETATLRVPRPIPAGSAIIRIVYTGILNDRLRGFYVSRATDVSMRSRRWRRRMRGARSRRSTSRRTRPPLRFHSWWTTATR